MNFTAQTVCFSKNFISAEELMNIDNKNIQQYILAEFNEQKKAEELAEKLSADIKIALVSDAGMPAISDPGYRIVRVCRERGIPVVAIPGSMPRMINCDSVMRDS